MNSRRWLILTFTFFVAVLAGWLYASQPFSYNDEHGSSQSFTAFPQSLERADKPDVVRIQFFGDMMLGREVANKMDRRGLDYLFEHSATSTTSTIFTGANFTIANLEGPFAPYRVNTSKSIAFRFKPELASELYRYGFSAVNLANNHLLDMGHSNAQFTRDLLLSNNIGFFGDQLSEDPNQVWGFNTVDNKNRVEFMGINTTDHQINRAQILAGLQQAEISNNTIIVNIHWGIEYNKYSSIAQQNLAHWLVDNGADAIIGHHPHVVQEMEVYKGKPIFYSLGNFIFDQYWSKDTQEGLSVELTIVDGEVFSAKLIPFYSAKSQVFLMEGKKREDFLKWFNSNSRLGDYNLDNIEVVFREY